MSIVAAPNLTTWILRLPNDKWDGNLMFTGVGLVGFAGLGPADVIFILFLRTYLALIPSPR